MSPFLMGAAGAAASLMAGCGPDGPKVIRGSGPVVREQRVYRPVDRLEVEGHTDLVVEVLPTEPGALPEASGAATVVFLEGAEDLLGWVETTLSGDTLTISFRDDVRLDPLPVIEVETAYLVSVECLGSGDIQLRGLTPRSTRGATLQLDFMGSADLQAQGQVGEIEVQKAGSGDLDLRSLESDRVIYSGLGSGDARVRASGSVTAALKGSGDLYVHGTVQAGDITTSVIGSGKLKHVPE